MGNFSDKGCTSARDDDLDVLISRQAISARVEELAGELTDYYGLGELTIIGVMTGVFIFLADLMRNLSMPIRLDVVSVCSYPGKSTKSSGPQLVLPPTADISGKNVLLVDDILDSGRTMTFLLDLLSASRPRDLKTCVLLRKDLGPDMKRPDADFFGFDVPDEFVVGYGLDYDDLYRGLPDICVLDPTATTEASK